MAIRRFFFSGFAAAEQDEKEWVWFFPDIGSAFLRIEI
jgi:hypothetical protein